MVEIGLNGLLLGSPRSGTAVYTRQLAAHLPDVAPDLSFVMFVGQAREASGLPVHAVTTPFTSLAQRSHIAAQLDKYLWETTALPVASALRRQVLLHSLYFAAPPLAFSPLVVTIHDLVPLILPGYHRTRQNAMYSRFMAATARRAAAIITVSEHSKQDILRVLKVPEDRVHVTYEAVEDRFDPEEVIGEQERLSARYGIPANFVLYAGGAERRKNIEVLVRAWAAIAADMRRDAVHLVIVADFPPPDRLYPDIPALVRELGLEECVHFVRRVPDEDMPALYRAAMLFCFPSLYEGFGFTPLEAMASGIPVLCSNAASLIEIAGPGAELLPPEDPSVWAERIRALVRSSSERDWLARRGLIRAGSFSWEETARRTADVYRKVLDG